MTRSQTMIVLIGALLLCGCRGSSSVSDYDIEMKGEILNFGRHYRAYHAEHGKSPSQLNDLKDQSSEFRQLYRRIRSGDFVVVWNAALSPNPADDAAIVLGHQKGVADEFGWVLLGDGDVVGMTAEEFSKTAKAKTE